MLSRLRISGAGLLSFGCVRKRRRIGRRGLRRGMRLMLSEVCVCVGGFLDEGSSTS